jgi:hypothetical protein
MMLGLGSQPTPLPGTGTNPAAVPLPGFTDGLKLWTSPGTALAAVSAAAGNPHAALSGPLSGFTFGVLAVPVAIIALVLTMNTKGN